MLVVSILTLIFSICILFLIISIANKKCNIGIIFLTLISFLILFAATFAKDIKVEYKKVPVEILKTSSCIIVNSKYSYRTIEEYSIIYKIDSTTVWYQEHTVNFWGGKRIESLLADFEIEK